MTELMLIIFYGGGVGASRELGEGWFLSFAWPALAGAAIASWSQRELAHLVKENP
jgi:hypothetical protein